MQVAVSRAFASRRGSPAVSRLAISTRAPTVRGRSSSVTAMSKARVVTAIIASPAPRPGVAAMLAR